MRGAYSVFVLLLAIQVVLSIKTNESPKLPTINCKLRPCSGVERPVCARIKHKNDTTNSVLYIRMVNNCEMEYLKCHQGIQATIVPLKHCDHPLMNNINDIHYRKKRSPLKTKVDANSEDQEDQKQRNTAAMEVLLGGNLGKMRNKPKNKVKNIKTKIVKSDNEDSDDYENLDKPKMKPKPYEAKERLQRIVHNTDSIKSDPRKGPMQRIIHRDTDMNKDIETTSKAAITTKSMNPIKTRGKVVPNERIQTNHLFRQKGGIIKKRFGARKRLFFDGERQKLPLIVTRFPGEYDMEYVSMESTEVPRLWKNGVYGNAKYEYDDMRLNPERTDYVNNGDDDAEARYTAEEAMKTKIPADHDEESKRDYPIKEKNEANNRVDNGNQDYVFEYDQYENAKDEEFEADCPKKCPARIMMVCARCKHGVYRTFLSICHMRMFNCQKAGERLQLVAREPCAVSAPHLATAEEYPDGKVGEPYDNDQVLHFIHSRNKEKVEILSEFLLNEMALANSRTNKSLDHDEELFLLNYNPDKENVYHLYTRKNRNHSQAMLLNDEKRLKSSNYDAQKKTVVLIHGWTNDMECHFYQTVTAAYLRAEDVNVITVDWSAGAKTEYLLAVRNTEKSGISVAKFLNWLNDLTGSTADKYHIVGFSLGGHQAGIAARHVKGNVRYVTALDPALPLWQSRPEKLRKSDGVYVEVIHTNAGDLGFVDALGDVDFYMNGGKTQPGCPTQNVLKKMVTPSCNHARAYHYFAESLQSSGFVGTKCNTAVLALNKNCPGSGKIVMGGIKPKMGLTGIYSVLTNDKAPFAKSRSS